MSVSKQNSEKKQRGSNSIFFKVGKRRFQIVKWALSNESKYFENLFSGKFADSDSKLIDLTEFVQDVDTFKLVLKYMRTGEFIPVVNKNNVGEMVRLASFFMIDSLLTLCGLWMMKQMLCSDWIPFCCIASKFNLIPIKGYLECLVSSRFHDLLIYEKTTLAVTSDQLDDLQERDFLKHCSYNILLLFLLKWLNYSRPVSKEKLAVALTILTARKSGENEIGKELSDEIRSQYELLKQELEKASDNEERADIVTRINDLLNDSLKEEQPADTQNTNTNTNELEKARAKVIFTVSERISIRKEEDSDEPSESEKKNTDADKPEHKLDICVYNTSSKKWYHIAEFDEKQYMSKFTEYFFDWTAEIDNLELEVVATENHIVFIDQNSCDEALLFNIKENTWKKFEFQSFLKDTLELDDRIRCYKLVRGPDDKLYVFMCIQLVDEDAEDLHEGGGQMIFFRVYLLDLEQMEFFVLGETHPAERVPACKDFHKRLRCMSVYVSEKNEEMFVLHSEGSGLDLVLKVNLKVFRNENGEPVIEFYHPEYVDITPEIVWSQESRSLEDRRLFQNCYVIEQDDRYIIVQKDGGINDVLTIKYEYSFETATLKPVMSGSKVNLSKYPKNNVDSFSESLFDTEVHFSFEDSYWQLEEVFNYVNIFQQVKYESTGELVEIDHTPPPFTVIVSACPAMVGKDFFDNLKPMSKFLQFSDN